jgi:hypothetical protein
MEGAKETWDVSNEMAADLGLRIVDYFYDYFYRLNLVDQMGDVIWKADNIEEAHGILRVLEKVWADQILNSEKKEPSI